MADQNNTKSIITVDDDVYYPSWWLKIMVDSALSNPNTVMAYRGHYIVNKNNRILTYMDWLNKSDKFLIKRLFIHLCLQGQVVFIILLVR